MGNETCLGYLFVHNTVRLIIEFMRVPRDNPELLRAQYRSFSRQMPMMYFILMSSTWALAATHMNVAPGWLTIVIPTLLTLVCAGRIAFWWRSRHICPSGESAYATLTRTNRLAAFIAIAFTIWSFLLFPYGDPYEKSHIAFYMAITVISCIFCLMHLRSAAFTVTAIVNGAFIFFFATTGEPTFIAIAINIMLVCFGMLAVLMVNYDNFQRMVQAQKEAEALGAENLRLANIDSLTGLPNRRAFFRHLNESFNLAVGNATGLAIGVIDLDGFKPVNDLHGHSTGDRLLVQVGERLKTLSSANEIFLARLGGDEFAFIISDVEDETHVAADVDRMCAQLQAPFVLPDATIIISGSVGIAVYPQMASTPEELFDHADYALYQGKREKRGNATFFTARHVAEIHRDARIEQALKQADLTEELSVVFQPVLDISQDRIIGFEALARWHSRMLGPLSPGQFIPIAERAGIISSLTRPLLKKALEAARHWPDDIRLSFNLSAQDLNSPEATIAIIAIIENSRFDTSRLDLEITETAFIHDIRQARRSAEMLRSVGCGISLDDFGTGYSSLTSLHSLPLTKIKIDRSFVSQIHDDPISCKIVRSVLTLSREMGLDAIVEGVETQEEIATLQTLGAVLIQGYICSRPMEQAAIAGFLASKNGGFNILDQIA